METDYKDCTSYAIECARKSGRPWVIAPRPHELFLDWDEQPNADRFFALLMIILRWGPKNGEFTELRAREWMAEHVHFFESRSENHMHVVVGLPFDVDGTTRRLFQTALGSDARHEIYSELAARSGAEHPTLLFRASRDVLDRGLGVLVSGPEEGA